MKKIISLMLVVLLLFTLVGCNQNEQMDEMAKKIAQLEQALQNQADVNDELSTELDEQKAANDWLGQLLLTQQGLLDEQQGVIDKQQTQIGRAEEAIDNLLGKPIEFTESAPVYGPREDEVELKKFFGYHPSQMDDFKNYYETEFREVFDEEFYLLENTNFVGGASHSFYFYAEENDGEYVNPMIREEYYVYDVALKEYADHWTRDEDMDGGAATVHFDVYLAPFPGLHFQIDLAWHLDLYFGKETVGEKEITYFNIYLGNQFAVCIGTCYYKSYAPLTARWFEKYIMNNLFKMED
ncbi:MAG: hypothetical protein IKC48_02210 [Clostridia bacterium]|nr:hypothetical protein [Clostridia bacterium]